MGEAKILYGKFIQTCVDFLIIALAIFVMVKIINELRRRYEDQPPAATPPRQEQLLEEIRDLLKRSDADGPISFQIARRPRPTAAPGRCACAARR